MIRPLCFAAVLLWPAVVLAQTPSLKIDDPAPTLKVAKWIKGGPVPAFPTGKITVVEFWATWCGPCKVAIPHLTELAKRYKGQVEFVGVDVLEQGEDFMPKVEKMVADFGRKMDYHVAADDHGFMVAHWLKASGGGAIPATYVVDGKGRLAWIGHPDNVEATLQKMIAGQWSNAAFAAERAEDQRLAKADSATIERLNPLVKDPQASLAEIAKIVAADPGLKYRRYVGHFTLNALLKSDPAGALEYGKGWIAANESDPPYGDVTDMISWKDQGPALNAFAAECLETQAKRFGDHMDQAVIYDRAATFHLKAGNRTKAIEAAQKALDYAKTTAGYAPEKIDQLAASLANLKATSGSR